jgi:multimeric flavodoxin WrbA
VIDLDWAILDGSNSENNIDDIVNILKNTIQQNGYSYKYFRLSDMNVLPCISCGTCTYKTPGKCILDDDTDTIMRSLAPSKGIILLTPIVFGGYSSQLKKAVDKFSLLGLPLFIVKDGHLLHPMRYGSKVLMGIGISDKNIKGEVDNFKLLIERNALNMQCSYYKALTFESSKGQNVENEILSMFKEVPR